MPYCALKELLMAIPIAMIVIAGQTCTLVHKIIPWSLEGYTQIKVTILLIS